MAIRTKPRSDVDVRTEASRVADILDEMKAAFTAIDKLSSADRALLSRLGDHGSAVIPTLARDAGLTGTAARAALNALTAAGLVTEGIGRPQYPAITNLGRVVLAEIRRRAALADGVPAELAGDLTIAAEAVARLRDRLESAA